jgi:hypothetical protein
MHYRPFKALGIWAFANISDQHRVFWIRVLHFVGMLGYAVVLALWLSRMQLSLVACAIAAVALLFHPVLPQALGSIDGIDSIASSALIWLGAWFAFVWRERIIRALIATMICFILAAGWKEYSFTIVPLAAWTVLCFAEKHRWRNAAILCGGLFVIFAGVLVVRQYAMPSGYGAVKGTDYLALSPIQWVVNAGVFATGLLFFGNSIWVYVHQSLPVLAMVAACMLIAFTIIALGIVSATRRKEFRPWVLFLAGSFIFASFPENVIFHVSEMYLTPLLFPMALLCGIAAQGYRERSPALRFAACGFAVVALLSSVWTIYWKIEGLRDVGERAEAQMRQIIALLPPDAHDLKVAMVFDLSELPPRRTYAVYRMGDEVLVVHAVALDWLVPERHLELGSFPLGREDFHPKEWDYIFKWNYAKQRFERWTAPS